MINKIKNLKFNSPKKYCLNSKINNLIDEYVRNCHSKKQISKSDLKEFIDKMANWYNEVFSMEEVFLKLQEISNEDRNPNTDVNFKNRLHQFMNSLTDKERNFLNSSSLYSDSNIFIVSKFSYFIVHKDGTILKAKNVYFTDENKFSKNLTQLSKDISYKLIGKNIFEVKKIFQLLTQYDIVKVIDEEISEYMLDAELLGKLLDCVMYRIIEQNKNGLGTKKAFLFAKQFRRNIEIPMLYSINTDDTHLLDFVNLYLKEGGSNKLVCPINYFNKENVQTIETITIQELIDNFYSNEKKAKKKIKV